MEKYTERHVQAIWYDARYRPANLRTTRGAPVRVIDPGEWNLEAGPDFLRAVVEIGGERRAGDVEIHLRPTDWRAHGHADDAAYAQVVLHVTWFGGETSVACPEIHLGDFLRTSFAPDEVDLGAYPFCIPPTTPRPCRRGTDDALALIAEYGRARIGLKARRLAARFLQTSRMQAFYEEVFAALGYKYNAFPFRAVAQRVPWRDLPSNPDNAATVLACAAGMSVTAEKPWRLDHVRPANTPERRLAAAARLFAEGSGLLARLLDCALETPVGQREAVRLLCRGSGTGSGAPGIAQPSIMGRGRAGAVLANAVVPYALAVGRLKSVPEWIAPEDVSRPVRLTAHRLLGRDHNPALYAGNGLLLQGLIQIHHQHCLVARGECGGCRLAVTAGPFDEGAGVSTETMRS